MGSSGYYFQPTVFGNVTNDMTIARQEVCCALPVMTNKYLVASIVGSFLITIVSFKVYGPVLAILPYEIAMEMGDTLAPVSHSHTYHHICNLI